jgi:uncharacterized damage-inducible protein DinB
MSLNHAFSSELQQEGASTKKMLERVPAEHFSWKPHEKSYSLGVLATHIAELPTWVGYTLKADELDFLTMNYTPSEVNTSADLMKLFEKNLEQAKEDFKDTADEKFMENWTLRRGEQVYFTMPKIAVLRSFVLNHIIHHRAQLSVYLRLLDIPVPGMYGPTADEKIG